ncbi:hypothetical protein MMC06_002238 [Schaereria dolodes]|nr:hypothetical protein [Schaereria dolodes]
MTLPTNDLTTTVCPNPSSAAREHEKPLLQTLISIYDFEAVALATLSPKAWAFYSSAATDLVTIKVNESFVRRIWWRPRVLKSVSEVDTMVQIQGAQSQLPFYVSPAAMAKLAHKNGER